MRRHPSPLRAAAWLCVIGLLNAPDARAQLLDQYISPLVFGDDTDPGVTVLSRQRPAYDNIGVRIGALSLNPTLTESAGYESNVLGARQAVGSSTVETAGAATLTSDWSRNSIHAGVSVDDNRYLDLPRQSFTNYIISLGGTYDLGRDLVTAQYQHQHINQTPRDLEAPQLQTPLGIDVDEGSLSYRINVNRLFLTPALDVTNFHYADGVADGLPYLQSYRDRVVVSPTVTLGYELAPRRDFVVVARDGAATYANQTIGVPRRDYNDPALLAGLDYDVTGLFRVRALLGYEARLFSSSAYKTLQAPVIEGTVIWNPTGLTTLTGTVSRHIQDTTDETIAASTTTSVALAVDHEYLRNVLLHGTAAYNLAQYGGGGGSQTLYTAGASVSYLANRNLRFSARYDFQSRQSNLNGPIGLFGQGVGSSYNDHRILLQLRLGL